MIAWSMLATIKEHVQFLRNPKVTVTILVPNVSIEDLLAA